MRYRVSIVYLLFRNLVLTKRKTGDNSTDDDNRYKNGKNN